MYLSVRITPVLKWLFMLLALTPMSLFQASSLSADSFTNASAFLFIALVFRYALDEDRFFGENDVILLGVSAIALSLSKSIYALILPLFFIIPPGKFQPGGVRRASALSMFILCAALIFIWASNNAGFAAVESTGKNIHPSLQLEYITTHPSDYAVIFARTLVISGEDLANQFIGKLGWLDISLPWVLRKSYLAVLFAAALFESNGATFFKTGQKSIIAIMVLLGVAALFTVIYVTWSPYKYEIILGMQGRYFIPLSPLFFSLLNSRRNFSDLAGKPFARFVGIYLPACWVWTILVLVRRHYAV
jgi:uncharacterized membrane protein